MADNGHHAAPATTGSMDISQHLGTYRAFISGSKWMIGFLIVLMIFMAAFRTHNG